MIRIFDNISYTLYIYNSNRAAQWISILLIINDNTIKTASYRVPMRKTVHITTIQSTT